MPKPPTSRMLDPIITRDIRMERVRNAIKVHIPIGVFQTDITRLDYEIEKAFTAASYELSAYVLGRRRKPMFHTMTMVIKTEEFTSWWQHTKSVHFPTISRWIRRPPRTRFIEHTQTERQEIKIWETFPEADLAELGPLPEGFGPVVIQAYDSGLHAEG